MSREARLERMGLLHLLHNEQELGRVLAEWKSASDAWEATLDALEASGTPRAEAIKSMPPSPLPKDFDKPRP